jgi:riboflavin kinase/FMN adenylyltransferase
MWVLRSSIEAQRELSSGAVAIGNFDGVHLGHRALFAHARRLARAIHGASIALTFDPHPARFFRPGLAPPLINTEGQKLTLLEKQGLDAIVIESFDHALAHMTPAEFTERILVERLHARHVIVGQNFVFGHGRSGKVSSLTELGQKLNFEVHGIPYVEHDDMVVSSSKIREFVLLGRVDGAARLLGRPYSLIGEVVRGEGRGATIGIPTANLAPKNELLPGGGVYVGVARLPDASLMDAVINIGSAPTFDKGDRQVIETHLLDFEGDLRGQALELYFIQRLRSEQRFAGVDPLVRQIRQDIERARKLLAEIPQSWRRGEFD